MESEYLSLLSQKATKYRTLSAEAVAESLNFIGSLQFDRYFNGV
jgi:hypothetical protein